MIRQRLYRTVFDIPLSLGLFAGSQWLLLWLGFADPVKLIVPFISRVVLRL
jgi:hypothetical protein